MRTIYILRTCSILSAMTAGVHRHIEVVTHAKLKYYTPLAIKMVPLCSQLCFQARPTKKLDGEPSGRVLPPF